MPKLRMIVVAGLGGVLAAGVAHADACSEMAEAHNTAARELQAAHDEFAATLLDGGECRHPLRVATEMEARKRTMLDLRKEMQAKGCAVTGGAQLSELEANVAEGPEMLAKMKEACDELEAAAEDLDGATGAEPGEPR